MRKFIEVTHDVRDHIAAAYKDAGEQIEAVTISMDTGDVEAVRAFNNSYRKAMRELGGIRDTIGMILDDIHRRERELNERAHIAISHR